MHHFLMVRDFEGALGKRLWNVWERSWGCLDTFCYVWGRFWGQPSHHLRRLGTYGGGDRDSFDVLGQSRGKATEKTIQHDDPRR